MTAADSDTLRARLVALRAAAHAAREAGADVPASGASARSAYDVLRSEPALAPFITAGRVKKLWAKLNAEQKAQEERDASPSADGVAALPRWPSNKSLRTALEKGDTAIFTVGEKLQALNQGGAPRGASADLDFRQSLLCLAQHWDSGKRAMALADKARLDATTSVIALSLRSAHVQPCGTPALCVEYAHGTRAAGTLAAVVSLANWLAAHHGEEVIVLRASLEEQQLWLDQLVRSAAAPGGTLQAQLRRSAVCSPPPAKDPGFEEPFAPPLGAKVCGHCGGPAKLTCAGCSGIHYCERACQKAHWKTHKPDCRGVGDAPASSADAGGAESVVFAAASPEGGAMAGMAAMTLNFNAGVGARSFLMGAAPPNPHGARRFMIKAQRPLTGGRAPLMVYDEPRAMTRMLDRAEGAAAYDALDARVAAHGVLGGAKGFFWARREGASVRVFTGVADLPSQQQKW